MNPKQKLIKRNLDENQSKPTENQAFIFRSKQRKMWTKHILSILFPRPTTRTYSAKQQQIAGHVEDSFNYCLPIELQMEVLAFLEPHQLLKLRLVCKRWKSLVNDDHLWRIKYFEEFGALTEKPYNGVYLWQELFFMHANVTWDPRKCDQMILSNNNKTVMDSCGPTERYKWTTIASQHGYIAGKHYVEIEVTKCCSSSINSIKIAFGLCHNTPRLLYNCPFGYTAFGFSRMEDKHSCCLMADGAMMLNCHPVSQRGQQWKVKDRVGVFFDFNTGLVQFYLNGAKQGDAMQFHKNKEMFVTVSLINGNEVSIVKPKYKVTSL